MYYFIFIVFNIDLLYKIRTSSNSEECKILESQTT